MLPPLLKIILWLSHSLGSYLPRVIIPRYLAPSLPMLRSGQRKFYRGESE